MSKLFRSGVSGMLTVILFSITLVAVIAAPILMMVFAPGFETKPDAEPELASYLLSSSIQL